MELKPTKPLSGFIELLPAQQRCFDECARRMLNVLRVSGFSQLDLPAIERAEVLTDKDNCVFIHTKTIADFWAFSSNFVKNIGAIPRHARSASALRAPPHRHTIAQPLPRTPVNGPNAPGAPIHA